MMSWDMELVKNMLYFVFPGRGFLIMAAALLLFCLIMVKFYPEGGILAVYSLMVLALFASPLGTTFLTKAMYNGKSYWRVLWILPYTAVMAYALTRLCTLSSKKAVRAVCVFAAAVLIAVMGNIAYIGNDKAYSMAVNREKVPPEIITMVNVINEKAESEGLTYKKAAVHTSLSPYIRTIDASIYMPYGRQPDSRGDGSSEWKDIRDGIVGKSECIGELGENLIRNHCNFAIAPEMEVLRSELEEAGFVHVGSAGEFTIWFNSEVAPDPQL